MHGPSPVRTILRWLLLIGGLGAVAWWGYQRGQSATLAWAEAYAEALAQVKRDPAAHSQLGQPIRVIAQPKRNSAPDGAPALHFTVAGPLGQAQVTTQLATRSTTWIKTAPLPPPFVNTPPPLPPMAKAAAQPSTTELSPIVAVVAPRSETKVLLGTIPGVMRYDKASFQVPAGGPVSLLFSNKACPLQHNLIILKPGTDAAYGKAADEMMQRDAASALRANYTPASPNIIAQTTKLIGLGQNEIINFTAPTEPGRYPYLCTFPGHRFVMKGEMEVVP